jgi:hypothetical protein
MAARTSNYRRDEAYFWECFKCQTSRVLSFHGCPYNYKRVRTSGGRRKWTREQYR